MDLNVHLLPCVASHWTYPTASSAHRRLAFIPSRDVPCDVVTFLSDPRSRRSPQAFRETLRRLNGKFSMRSLADTNRYLLREDNATRLEFGTNGTITKSKSRRLVLLNDLVVCVSVAGKTAEEASAPDRLTLKWSVPVTDVEIQETSTSLTLSHVITATAARPAGAPARGSEETAAAGAGDLSNVGQLCHKMGNLMHDYEVVSRIGALVETLKGDYPVSGRVRFCARAGLEEICEDVCSFTQGRTVNEIDAMDYR